MQSSYTNIKEVTLRLIFINQEINFKLESFFYSFIDEFLDLRETINRRMSVCVWILLMLLRTHFINHMLKMGLIDKDQTVTQIL